MPSVLVSIYQILMATRKFQTAETDHEKPDMRRFRAIRKLVLKSEQANSLLVLGNFRTRPDHRTRLLSEAN